MALEGSLRPSFLAVITPQACAAAVCRVDGRRRGDRGGAHRVAGDAAVGRVAISLPDPALRDDGAVWGWLTFDLPERPRRAWWMAERGLVTIAPPYPPNEAQPANLPLRLSLARAILAVLRDEAAPDAWLGVTSLAPRDDLARMLPTTHAAAAQAFGGAWRLDAGAVYADTPRAALCRLLGLAQASAPGAAEERYGRADLRGR